MAPDRHRSTRNRPARNRPTRRRSIGLIVIVAACAFAACSSSDDSTAGVTANSSSSGGSGTVAAATTEVRPTDPPTTTTATTATTTTMTGAEVPEPGATGLGDRLLPLAGNGGYDVSAYDLTMSWDPGTSMLDATALIDAVTTQDLMVFDLDLRGYDVASVEVNGTPAQLSRDGQELTITLPAAVAEGGALDMEVAYRGVPEPVIDPDGSSEGWMTIDDGIVALGEPQGSPGWFPVNDHPTDKATFSLRVTVPSEFVVVSNGVPSPPAVDGERTTYTWTEAHLMAPYLATVSIGHFTMTTTQTTDGLPVITAVGPGLEEASAPTLARIPEMIGWLTELLGPYPFDSTGAIVVDAPDVGYALETQGRPTFTSPPDDSVMIHELAHQWFGNSVSLAAWDEIWLNEGFAGYVEWLWADHDGATTAEQTFAETFAAFEADDPFWQSPPGPDSLTDAADLFGTPVYVRGAMTLGALRREIGEASFFTILRSWAAEHRNGNVTTAEFIELSERVAGRPLDDLFTAWLSTPSKPAE